jgi:predicted XRE-type DNA-binding protein
MTAHWEAKRDWHERQRNLPLPRKIEILIALQHRQQEINQMKIAMGLPPVPMRVWQTRP